MVVIAHSVFKMYHPKHTQYGGIKGLIYDSVIGHTYIGKSSVIDFCEKK